MKKDAYKYTAKKHIFVNKEKFLISLGFERIQDARVEGFVRDWDSYTIDSKEQFYKLYANLDENGDCFSPIYAMLDKTQPQNIFLFEGWENIYGPQSAIWVPFYYTQDFITEILRRAFREGVRFHKEKVKNVFSELGLQEK